MSSQANAPLTTATELLRSSRPTSIETGVTARKNPATSPRRSSSRCGAISGVRNPISRSRAVPVHANRPEFHKAPAAIRSQSGRGVEASRKSAPDAACERVERRPGDDVAISGLGAGGDNAHRHQPAEVTSGLQGAVGRLAKGHGVTHGPVGVQREDIRLRIALQRLPGGPHQRRSGRGGARLDQHVARFETEMLHQSGSERGTGHDQHVLARHQSFEPIYRLLRGGSLAAERRSCLGLSGVLRGQKRVPAPPARITAHLMSARPSRAAASKTGSRQRLDHVRGGRRGQADGT